MEDKSPSGVQGQSPGGSLGATSQICIYNLHCSGQTLFRIGVGDGAGDAFAPPPKFGRKIFFGQTLCNIRAVDIFLEEGRTGTFLTVFSFYRAMHYSTKPGIAIACRLGLSVCLSVRPSVTLVDHDHTG